MANQYDLDLGPEFFVCQGQSDFYWDWDNRFPAGVSGLGGGKTLAGCWKALALSALNPGLPGLIVEPTFGMIERVLIPTFVEKILTPNNIGFNLNRSKWEMTLPWRSKIWFTSAERPERIVGTNVAWAYLDELGLMPELAFQNVNSRVREPQAQLSQVPSTFTPEIGGFTHDRWGREELFNEPLPPGFSLYQWSTYDNVELTEEFIKSLEQEWGPEEAQARVYGRFKVVRSGRAYYAFDMAKHVHSDLPYDVDKPIWFCWDFNETPGVHVEVIQHQGPRYLVIDEIFRKGLTVEDAADECVDRYQDHMGPIYITGDATGRSSASKRGYYKIIQEHYKGLAGKYTGFANPPQMDIPSRNPSVTDRVAMFNSVMHRNDFMVDRKCKQLIMDLDTMLTNAAKAAQQGKSYKGEQPNHPDKTDINRSHASDSAGYHIVRKNKPRTAFDRADYYKSIRAG